MIEMVIAIIIGSVLGIVAGLLPGLHPNNVIPIILGMSFYFDPLTASIILIVSGVVNPFVNFIPSILLGAPEDSTVLGVLPGHKLLMEGRGFEAIKLSVMGSLGGVIISVMTLPIFAMFIPVVYDAIRPSMHILLSVVMAYMIMIDGEKHIAVLVFFLSGILGLIVLNFSDAALFPMLSGLFGLPTLLISIWSKSKIPEKFEEKEENLGLGMYYSMFVGTMAGILAGLLPGLGSAQSTILTQQITKMKDSGRSFLVSIGSVSTSDIVYSTLALYLIGNARSGIAVAVGNLIEVGLNETMIFIAVIIVSAAIGAVSTLKLTKISIKILKKVEYGKLCMWTFVFVCALIFVFSGLFGLLVGLVAMIIGLIPNFSNVRRTHSMGCLIIPTIFYFAGISLFNL